MQSFIADKEVIEFAEHFFVHDKIPYLTVILSYRDMDQDRKKIISREDPRKELDDIGPINNEPDNRNNNLGFRLSSSQQRPDAVCLRIHHPCYALTIAPDLFQRMLDK